MVIPKSKLRQYKEDIILFLEEQYCIPETRSPIVLEEWQKEQILKPLFNTKEDGRRKYNLAIISTPKKNGKSTLASAIITWFAFCGELNGEIIIAANDKEQGTWVIFNKTVWAIQRNPILRNSAEITKDAIRIPSTNTIIRVIAQDYSSASGLNPSLTVFDELWAFEHDSDQKFFDELTLVPTRKEPLMLIVTYAGFEGKSLLHSLYERGLKGDDPQMFFYWTHENNASWVTGEYLGSQRRRLRPNTYLRLHENRWVVSEESFIELELWDACVKPDRTPLLPTKDVELFVGVDASTKRDSSAVVAVYKREDSIFLALAKKWQPSKEKPLDLEATVEAYLRWIHESYDLHAVLYDPYQFHRSAMTLEDAGLRMEEFPQTVPNQTMATSTLYDVIKGRNLVLYPDDDLRDHCRMAIAVQNPRGIRLAKEKTTHKIDLMVALSMAVYAATRARHGADDTFAKNYARVVE